MFNKSFKSLVFRYTYSTIKIRSKCTYVYTFTNISFQVLDGYFRFNLDGDNGALLLLLNIAPQASHLLQRMWDLLPHEHSFSREAVKGIYMQGNCLNLSSYVCNIAFF